MGKQQQCKVQVASSATKITAMSQRITDLNTKQQEQFTELRQSSTGAGHIAFNCYRNTSFSGSISYSECDVNKSDGAMDKNTGRFKAKKRGLYRFTFNAMVAYGKKAFAYIRKDISGDPTKYLHAMSQYNSVNEYGHMGGNVITELEVGQEVYAFSSYNLYSDVHRYITFEGFFLAPL